MKTPYGFPIIDDCMSCSIVVQDAFCDLPESSRIVLNQVRHSACYPRGAVLFVQGQPAAGVFSVCMGQVKLYSTADCGTTLIHRICGPGEVLGIGETVLGSAYQATGETISPSMMNYIKHDDLVKLLRTDSEIALRVAWHLSQHLATACHQLQDQRFRESALEKMASFLLDSCNDQQRISISLTHEEIGEIIGLARETVTRALRELKNRNIIRIHGHLITVLDPRSLSEIAGH